MFITATMESPKLCSALDPPHSSSSTSELTKSSKRPDSQPLKSPESDSLPKHRTEDSSATTSRSNPKKRAYSRTTNVAIQPSNKRQISPSFTPSSITPLTNTSQQPPLMESLKPLSSLQNSSSDHKSDSLKSYLASFSRSSYDFDSKQQASSIIKKPPTILKSESPRLNPTSHHSGM